MAVALEPVPRFVGPGDFARLKAYRSCFGGSVLAIVARRVPLGAGYGTGLDLE